MEIINLIKSEKTGQPERMGRKTLRKNCSDSLPNLTSYRPQAANVVNHPCWCDWNHWFFRAPKHLPAGFNNTHTPELLVMSQLSNYVCVYIYVYKYMYYYYILMYMLSVATDPPRVPFSSPKEIPNKTSHDIPLIRSLQKVCHCRHQVLGHSHDTGELPVAQRRVKHGIYWGYMRIYICIYPSINLSIYLSFYLSMIYLCICICTYGVWDVTTVWYGFVWKWGIPKHVKPINFT